MRIKKRFAGFLLLVICCILLLNIRSLGQLFFPVKYAEYINQYAVRYAVDPYLVMGIIKTESNFDETAVSHKNASGLMQIIEPTALWLAEKMELSDFTYEDITTPALNIEMGCYYMAYLLDLYDGNTETALAAYNAGAGNVNNWLADSTCSTDGKNLCYIPFPETRRYVNRVVVNRNIYTFLYDETQAE